MRKCYELLRDVLMDAFDVSTIYFAPPYEDISRIDQGLRAAVWTDYNDQSTKIQLSNNAEQQNRLLIIRSNLGFYNIMIFWKGNESAEFISVGPFRNDELSPAYFTQVLKDAQITPAKIRQIKSIYETMPYAQVESVSNVCKRILSSYIEDFKNVTPELIEYTEQQRPIEIHNDVLEEYHKNFSEKYLELFSAFLKHLKGGDNEQAKKALHLFIHESKLATKKTMRSYKALLSMLNNFCHMTLLQTPVHPSHTLRLASSIGLRIENTTSLSKLEQMPNDICHKYCLLIKNYANNGYSKLTRDVSAYIQMHLDEDLSLSELASIFGKNASSLSAIFSRETGQTLTNFVQHARIHEALRLMNSTKYSVSEIAVTVGYQDFSYFSKVFSKIVGMSPRAYIRQSHAALHH